MAQAKRPRRGPKPPKIELAPDEREALEALARRVSAPQRDVLRARIVLFAAEGLGSRAIAERLGIDQDTVGKWRRRFAKGRVKALCDAPRAGRPPKFSAHQKARA